MDEEKNFYIDFTIFGLGCKVAESDKNRFDLYCNGNKNISVKFFSDDNGINKIRVYCPYTQALSKEIDEITQNIKFRVYWFILKLIEKNGYAIIHRNIKVDMSYSLNSHIHHEYIHVRDDMQMISVCSIGEYKKAFSAALPIDNDNEIKIKLSTLFELQKIKNSQLRYLMEYDFLMSIIGRHEGCKLRYKGQSKVKQFIDQKYNNREQCTKIGCHESTNPNRNRNRNGYEEDDITFCRNLLAHNYKTELYERYEELIDTMSVVIIDVIRFAIQECVINSQAQCRFKNRR